jgi:FlaA1/EpsC-like NDP-sugar epimerase
LGVALGLTNLLVRRLVGKGYVRIAKMGTRHIRYLMTASGWEALSQATRDSLENTVHLYTQTREQIRTSLSVISEGCEQDATGQKRVVFYGAGDVAEIAYVSLQSTDLTLVGVVDDRRSGRFFNLPICSPEQLSATTVGTITYGHVVVTSLRHADAICARIDGLGVPSDRVSCL